MELLQAYIGQKRKEYQGFYAQVHALCRSAEGEAMLIIDREEQQLLREYQHANSNAVAAKISQLHQTRYLHFQNIMELLLSAMRQMSITVITPPPSTFNTALHPKVNPTLQLLRTHSANRLCSTIRASPTNSTNRPSAIMQASYTPIPPQIFHRGNSSKSDPRSSSPIMLIRHSEAPATRVQLRPDITPTPKQYQSKDPPAPSAELGSFNLTPLTPVAPSGSLSPPGAPVVRESVQID